jgi:ribose transport system substrate-binding protein
MKTWSNLWPNARGLRAAALAVVPMVAVALGACGSDDSASDQSESASSGSAEQVVADARAEVEQLFSQGSFESPPTSGPPIAPGKNVWLVSIGLPSPIDAAVVSSANQAAELVGWDATTCDGKFNPNEQLNCIRSALAAGADGIGTEGFDCASVEAGLKDAADMDIPVVAIQGQDCSEAKPGTPPLFAGVLKYSDGDFVDWAKAFGAAQANWIIDQTEGKAKVIHLKETDAVVLTAISDGFEETMAKCSTCEIVDTVEFVGGELGPPLQSKLEQALVKNPDANAIDPPYDAVTTSGLSQAVASSGRGDELAIVSGADGVSASFDLVRSGAVDAGVGLSPEWEGFALIDGLNRVFNGQEVISSGNGLQLYDAETNLPPPGEPFDTGIDYKAAYEKSWGLGG